MCDIDPGDGDWNVWSYTPHVARKQYSCNGCGALVAPGEPYCSLFAAGSDGTTSERMCFACWWTLTAFGDAHCFSTAPSALKEFLVECLRADGDDSEWRPDLAALKRRERMSPRGRKALARQWGRRRDYEATRPT